MSISILDSLMDSGKVTEVQILVALHKTGAIDFASILGDSIRSVKKSLESGILTSKERLDAMKYLQVGYDIVESCSVVDEIADHEISEPVDVPTTQSNVTVV